MNEHFVIQTIPSVVSEPDYVGPNGTQRSPIKLLVVVLIVSIAICGIAMNLLADSMTLLGHVFWLVFHVVYIGGLVYYFGKKWRQRSLGVEA
jgi:hypothetical protein